MPSKYQPLADWLAVYPGTEVWLTFAQVEQLVGTPLPDIARASTSWWTTTHPTHVHTQTWRDVGWEVAAVDRLRGVVLYRRESLGGP